MPGSPGHGLPTAGHRCAAHVEDMIITSARIDQLAGALIEASACATDGTRRIEDYDAPVVAAELLTGDNMPSWLQSTPSDLVFEIARHQRAGWVAEVITAAGTSGGWVCECGAIITDTVDLSIPGGLAGIPAGNVWMARHQVAILAESGVI